MKRYITFVLAAVALLGVTSCSTDSGIAAPDGEGQMALRFESSSMTRATEGVADLNENLIKTIDCYFYPSSADENTKAVWYQQFTFGTDDAGVNSRAEVTDILMPSGEMNAIFGSGTTGTGKIYAIANYAGGSALPTSGEGTSVAALKATVVSAAWLDGSSKFQTQASFVMDSEMVTINKTEGNTITGSVPLNRTAAKVELSITSVAESVQNSDGKWWVPAITVTDDGTVSQANVTMYNARTAASVGGTAQTYSAGTHTTLQNYGFSAANNALPYKQTNPFYTYPHAWTNDSEEAYLLLVVYWQQTDKESEEDTDYQLVGNPEPCYYEIPIGAADNSEIERNHFYQIGINVGTLGSFVKEDPEQLTPSYMVVDWGTGEISANIKGQQYLVVDENKVDIYNQDVYEIAYASSHPVTAVITKITKPNYSQETESTVNIYNNSNGATSVTPANNISGNKETFTVSIVDGKVRLSHTLNNDNTTNGFDYVPYDITVVVTNEVGMSQTITYKQYPAMYIKADRNPGQPNNSNRGYVYIYGTGSGTGWQALVDLTSGGNHNPNMYVITTTAMDSSSSFILGDTRSDTYVTGQSLSIGNTINGKTLQYYYPSRTDDDNYLAPAFRIASSYGKCSGTVTHDEAKRRCAAYQEYGFPAGRWRVPTTAEMQYIAKISRKGWIPHLFSDGKNYWAASERITYSTSSEPTGNNSTSGNAYIRCVYDEWYWGADKCAVDTFTWGDQQK